MRDNVKLSPTERFMLANQYRILAKLYPSEKRDYERHLHVLEAGYPYLYHTILGSIDPEVPVETSEYVLSVLDMFSALKTARAKLPKKDAPAKELGRFVGFDANDESDEYRFACYFTGELDRYRNLGRNPIPNSHHSTRHIYAPMLEAWRKSADTNNLTKDDVRRIIAAAARP
jgi:uncharacterized protein YfbU (UPF0304 family)